MIDDDDLIGLHINFIFTDDNHQCRGSSRNRGRWLAALQGVKGEAGRVQQGYVDHVCSVLRLAKTVLTKNILMLEEVRKSAKIDWFG